MLRGAFGSENEWRDDGSIEVVQEKGSCGDLVGGGELMDRDAAVKACADERDGLSTPDMAMSVNPLFV